MSKASSGKAEDEEQKAEFSSFLSLAKNVTGENVYSDRSKFKDLWGKTQY